MKATIEAAIYAAPYADLQEFAAHWLQTAVDLIPLDESPEEIATGLWSAVGATYSRLPEWMQEAAYAAWLDRNPGDFEGRRKKAERAHLQRLEAWSQGWACFVEGRHDT
jgi:hypothetical protein